MANKGKPAFNEKADKALDKKQGVKETKAEQKQDKKGK